MADAWEINSSGMQAEWKRIRTVSRNMAHADSTAEDGDPYRKRYPVFTTALDRMNGVEVADDHISTDPYSKEYEPGHPHAGEDGMVKKSNVNMTIETVDMMEATRAYEANFMALQNYRKIANKTLEIME